MRPIQILFGLDAQTGIVVTQTTGGAGALTLDGTLVADGVADLTGGVQGAQQTVRLASANNNSAINYTITGYDCNGVLVTEEIAGPNATSVFTVQSFATITSISADAATDAIDIGVFYRGASAAIPLDQYISPFNVTLVALTTRESVTVQYTVDNVWDPTVSNNDLSWFDLTNLTTVVEATVDTLISPVSAVRVVLNDSQGQGGVRVVQAGTH